jgi:hypothetical protein
MDIEEIKSNLCYYDERNPYNNLQWDEKMPTKDCYCDNCFYGRTKLAEYILKLLNEKV